MNRKLVLNFVRRSHRMVCFGALLLAASFAQGQDKDQNALGKYQLPQKPFLLIKSYKYPGALKLLDENGREVPISAEYLRFHARLQKTEVTVDSGGLRRDMYFWESGMESEKWYFDGVSYETLKQDCEKVMIDRAGFGNNFDDGKNDLPELSGIAGMKMLGKERFRDTGAICFVFSEEGESTKKIWVNAQTGYPVAVETKEVTETFEFRKLESGMKLRIPAKFDRWIQASQRQEAK